MPAVGAIFEFRRELFPALRAAAGRFGMKKIRLGAAAFVKNAAATVTFQKRLSALDGNQGDEEQAKIMIPPFPPGRRQAAGRTGPRLIVDLNFLRLHSANEDEDAPLLENQGFHSS
jgi:hypothetical protein